MLENELLGYIRTEIHYHRTEPLSAGDALLDGALESVDVSRLVVFVEERYSITIDDDDLVSENFATVTALAGFLRAKSATQTAD